MLKAKLIDEMKKYFADDQIRIEHTLKVTDYAEKLVEDFKEKNSAQDFDEKIVIYTAVLHDIGIKNAEEKYSSSAGHYQEIEGPPAARKIMKALEVEPELIAEITEIIAHHHTPGKIRSNNFKLLYDADWLVNLPAIYDLNQIEKDEINKLIERVFLSKSGKELARKEFF